MKNFILPVFLFLFINNPSAVFAQMPENVRQTVNEMRAAGASHQEIRQFIENSRNSQRGTRPHFTGRPFNGQGRQVHMPVTPHALDATLIKDGYNLVVDKNGREINPQGKPIQEGYRLIQTDHFINDNNRRAYAKVFTIMAPVRDALLFDIRSTSEKKWTDMTAILERNSIKTKQWLGGPTPKDNYYSSRGIFDHLKTVGKDFHPTMKYLEEAELELKCRLFSKDFNFTNPEGHNACPTPGTGLM